MIVGIFKNNYQVWKLIFYGKNGTLKLMRRIKTWLLNHAPANTKIKTDFTARVRGLLIQPPEPSGIEPFTGVPYAERM